MLSSHILVLDPSLCLSSQVLRTHLEYPRPLLPGQHTRYGRAAQEMSVFMHPRHLQPGEVRARTPTEKKTP